MASRGIRVEVVTDTDPQLFEDRVNEVLRQYDGIANVDVTYRVGYQRDMGPVYTALVTIVMDNPDEWGIHNEL